MQSIRRAAFRASCSALRVAAPKQQITPFAMQISQNISRPAMTQLFPRQFSSDSAPESSPTANENLRQGFPLYIGNMSFDATETHIHEAFGKYGEILSVNVPRDARGLARGFAFVNFKDQSAIEAAVDGANQSFWHGRRIIVQARAEKENPRRERKMADAPTEPTQYLYIGNIPYETSDADLNSLFRSLDGVRDVRIAIDRNTGWPRGFAHCDFESVEAAEAAKEKIGSYQMGTRTLRADYSFAPRAPRERFSRANSYNSENTN